MSFKARLAGKSAPKSFDNWDDWKDITGFMQFPNGVVPRNLIKVVGNNIFAVQMYGRESRWGQLTELVVRRLDGNEIRDNEILLRIKDELCGAELDACEHLPASIKRLPIDQTLRVVWVMPAGFFLPFNYGAG